MIFLTLVAFIAVAYEGFSRWFTVPFIVTAGCCTGWLSTLLFYAYES